MGIIVTKFGGSSLADAAQFKRVKKIITSDNKRCYVIPSAPGRRFSGDDKVTDLLYQLYALRSSSYEMQSVFERICERYESIAKELELKTPVRDYLEKIRRDILEGETVEYCASRGEYLNGLLMAEYINYSFLDPADFVFFDDNKIFQSEKTNSVLEKILKENPKAVIPGFYGRYEKGGICTFSRGGSDITGAVVARAAQAELYENWTDVSGFMMADPRLVRDAKPIRHITYQELRELSYMGASVLHEDSVFPVHRAGIPTNIRNTNAPDEPGTLISHDSRQDDNPYVITGIAGKKGFSVISVEKAMMNAELGFGRRVLQALEENHLSFEHMPTGIDSLCVVLPTDALKPVRETVLKRIMELTEPDSLTVTDDLSIIATVGASMVHNPGTAFRLFLALSRAKVNVRMIVQGSSELSILVGVDSKDCENAIRSIYHEFVWD